MKDTQSISSCRAPTLCAVRVSGHKKSPLRTAGAWRVSWPTRHPAACVCTTHGTKAAGSRVKRGTTNYVVFLVKLNHYTFRCSKFCRETKDPPRFCAKFVPPDRQRQPSGRRYHSEQKGAPPKRKRGYLGGFCLLRGNTPEAHISLRNTVM